MVVSGSWTTSQFLYITACVGRRPSAPPPRRTAAGQLEASGLTLAPRIPREIATPVYHSQGVYFTVRLRYFLQDTPTSSTRPDGEDEFLHDNPFRLDNTNRTNKRLTL